jgi:hypothetical protein
MQILPMKATNMYELEMHRLSLLEARLQAEGANAQPCSQGQTLILTIIGRKIVHRLEAASATFRNAGLPQWVSERWNSFQIPARFQLTGQMQNMCA